MDTRALAATLTDRAVTQAATLQHAPLALALAWIDAVRLAWEAKVEDGRWVDRARVAAVEDGLGLIGADFVVVRPPTQAQVVALGDGAHVAVQAMLGDACPLWALFLEQTREAPAPQGAAEPGETAGDAAP